MERGTETEKRKPPGDYVEEDDEPEDLIDELADKIAGENKMKKTLGEKRKKIHQKIKECDEEIDKIHEKLRCPFVPQENQAEGEDYDKKEMINRLAIELVSCLEKKSSLEDDEQKISQQIRECLERNENFREKMRCQFEKLKCQFTPLS